MFDVLLIFCRLRRFVVVVAVVVVAACFVRCSRGRFWFQNIVRSTAYTHVVHTHTVRRSRVHAFNLHLAYIILQFCVCGGAAWLCRPRAIM